MERLLSLLLWAIAISYSIADTPSASLYNTLPPEALSTACGRIVKRDLFSSETESWFAAGEAIACLRSVPFNADVALRFLVYYNQTLQFQSTLGYLKSPPSWYSHPPIDVLARIADITQNVESGYYKNQYAFEHDIQSLVLSMHDSHVVLKAGVLNQFSFGSPLEIASVSLDGHAAPRIYLYDDLRECMSNPPCRPSPLKSINGVDAIVWVTELAEQQSFGMLERHADWNQFMKTLALQIQGKFSTFSSGLKFFPGDSLSFELENGTLLKTSGWRALYQSPGYTGPLATGGDFYNYFVLGHNPANYDYAEYFRSYETHRTNNTSQPEEETNVDLHTWHYVAPAYPQVAPLYQDDLGIHSPGVVTAYGLNHINTAVLSIPTFDTDVRTFSRTVRWFIDEFEGAKSVIIDLQQNTGGSVALALDAYRQLFPTEQPDTASRMRAHGMANALGQVYNQYLALLNSSSGDYKSVVASEWVVQGRVNPKTGQPFQAWAYFYGPLEIHEDSFTRDQQYNLTDENFIASIFNVRFPSGAFQDKGRRKTDPWAAADIILLTDGLCASACAIFVELVTALGARTVVVGGHPDDEPMQAVSGTRGAARYSAAELDADIVNALRLDPTLPLPARNNANRGMLITYAGVNLRDQVRRNDTTPTQFQYLPADCRLYWTLSNFDNYTQLWTDAWTATRVNFSMCVAGSTNVPPRSLQEPVTVNADQSEHSDAVAGFVAKGLSLENLTAEEQESIEVLNIADAFSIFGVSDAGEDLNPDHLQQCGDPKDGPEHAAACRKLGRACQPFTIDCMDDCDEDDDPRDCQIKDFLDYLCMTTCETSVHDSGWSSNNCNVWTTCRATTWINQQAYSFNEDNTESEHAFITNYDSTLSGLCTPHLNKRSVALPLLPSCSKLADSSLSFKERYFG